MTFNQPQKYRALRITEDGNEINQNNSYFQYGIY